MRPQQVDGGEVVETLTRKRVKFGFIVKGDWNTATEWEDRRSSGVGGGWKHNIILVFGQVRDWKKNRNWKSTRLSLQAYLKANKGVASSADPAAPPTGANRSLCSRSGLGAASLRVIGRPATLKIGEDQLGRPTGVFFAAGSFSARSLLRVAVVSRRRDVIARDVVSSLLGFRVFLALLGSSPGGSFPAFVRLEARLWREAFHAGLA